jgi:hypothetical protein
MIKAPEAQIGLVAKGVDRWQNEGGPAVPQLARFRVDDGPHDSDGLLLHGWDGTEQVMAFISRRVMDDWAGPRRSLKSRHSLSRDQYNALGKSKQAAVIRFIEFEQRDMPAFERHGVKDDGRAGP